MKAFGNSEQRKLYSSVAGQEVPTFQMTCTEAILPGDIGTALGRQIEYGETDAFFEVYELHYQNCILPHERFEASFDQERGKFYPLGSRGLFRQVKALANGAICTNVTCVIQSESQDVSEVYGEETCRVSLYETEIEVWATRPIVKDSIFWVTYQPDRNKPLVVEGEDDKVQASVGRWVEIEMPEVSDYASMDFKITGPDSIFSNQNITTFSNQYTTNDALIEFVPGGGMAFVETPQDFVYIVDGVATYSLKNEFIIPRLQVVSVSVSSVAAGASGSGSATYDIAYPFSYTSRAVCSLKGWHGTGTPIPVLSHGNTGCMITVYNKHATEATGGMSFNVFATETAFTPQMKLYQSSDINFNFWLGAGSGTRYGITAVRLSDIFERYDSRIPNETGAQPFALSGIATAATWPREITPQITPRGSNILNNQNHWDMVTDVSGTVTIIPIGKDRNQYTEPPSGGGGGVNPL